MTSALKSIRSLSLVVAASVAGHAAGQTMEPAPSDDDWTILRSDDVLAAYVRYDSGLSIVARCVEGRMEAWIGGLPQAAETLRTRPVALGLNEPPERPQEWYIGRDRAAVVSTSPARFARWLREGGTLNISLPGAGEGGRNVRYVADLPASTASLDEALTACEKPLDDPRDADAETDAAAAPIRWARQPRPQYPTRRVYEWGFASVSCMSTPEGRLEQCEIDNEHPARGGFGEATLRSLDGARLETDGGTVPRRMVSFIVRYQMGGSAGDAVSFAAPTRLRATP